MTCSKTPSFLSIPFYFALLNLISTTTGSPLLADYYRGEFMNMLGTQLSARYLYQLVFPFLSDQLRVIVLSCFIVYSGSPTESETGYTIQL